MKPCKECPFRKNSIVGYLGEELYNPKGFLLQLDENIVPCHLTIDWENEKLDRAIPCIGSMQFMNNSGRLSRAGIVARIQRNYGKNENIFQFYHEFIEHHSKNEDH